MAVEEDLAARWGVEPFDQIDPGALAAPRFAHKRDGAYLREACPSFPCLTSILFLSNDRHCLHLSKHRVHSSSTTFYGAQRRRGAH